MKTPSLIDVCSAEDGRARVRELVRVRECIARGVDPASVPWSRLPWEALPADLSIGLGIGQSVDASLLAWSPLNLGASLFAWYRGDQYNATTGTWTELSSNGRHLTQGTEANRPAASTLNGLACVDFDGTNDILDSAAFGAPLAQPYTIFVVAKDDLGTAGSRTLIDTSSALSSNRMTILQPANVVMVSGNTFVTGSAMGTTARILEFVVNGASSKFRMDGGTEATGNPGANTWGQIRFGANSVGGAGTFWDGPVGEAIVATGELDAATRTKARRYLAARWGITV